MISIHIFTLEQVKNRLDPTYDAVKSAGYRDVLITIRIVNADTIGWIIENHVCELQLILSSFFAVKVSNSYWTRNRFDKFVFSRTYEPMICCCSQSAAGHQNYVNFRNLRGE